MTTHEDRTLGEGTATEPAAVVWAPGPGHAYPATAGGVPLSAFAFAFAVGCLGLFETNIINIGVGSPLFLSACFGIGAVGLFIGGMWEYRGGELFGGTFGVGYAGFLLSTAILYQFFAEPMIKAAGVANFDHAVAAWLIMWALFTATFAISASAISWTAVAPFTFAFIVLIVLAIGSLGGTAGWTTNVNKVGGWFALIDSFAAGYLGCAIIINVSLGKDILPLFPTKLWKS